MEADEAEELRIKGDENSAVKWWKNEDALKASTEPWLVDNIYRKLIKKQEQYRESSRKDFAGRSL